MSCGKQFVAKLKKLGYASAEKLNGEDFDWLFETADTKSFIKWFCGHVGEQHMLSEDTLKSLNSLKEAGKFILEEKDLDEVLKTCNLAEYRSTAQEELELEKLEEEFKLLQKTKDIKMKQCEELRIMTSTNSHKSLVFKEEEEVASKNLKSVQETGSVGNVAMNNELNLLIEGVKTLLSFLSSNAACRSVSQPALLSHLSLESYLSGEQLRTATLTSYSKKQFFEGISELIDSSNEENFQLLELDINRSYSHDESSEMREGRRREMARLQLAYICAKQQLVQLKVNVGSLKAGLHYASEHLHSAKHRINAKEENLEVRVTSLKNELAYLNKQVKQIYRETLPNLVKENAQLLNMPIVKGDFDLQIARQDYYTSKQDLICSQLLKQKSSFELLQLAYEIELRKHRELHRQLEALVEDLKRSSSALLQRLNMLSDPSVYQLSKPKNTVDLRDGTAHRIYELIEGQTEKQQLFKTYEGLEQIAKNLMHILSSLQSELAVSSQEQCLIISKMEAEVKSLRESMYRGEEYLMLSAQEYSQEFQQLESQMKSLNQLVMDLVGVLKHKRNILETNKLHKMEKQLYVHFFKDAERLKSIVEQFEEQANIDRST